MAKTITHKGNTTRGKASRVKRWGRSLSRKRQEVTRLLPLSGMHPAQLSLVDLSIDQSYGDFSFQDAPPLSVYQQGHSITQGRYVAPAAPLQLDYAAPVAVTPSERATPCEARHERREVLFATGKVGGNHAPTPKSDKWGEPC